MGHICYTCKKVLKWGNYKWTYDDILRDYKLVPPIGFTPEDRLCDNCKNQLPKQVYDLTEIRSPNTIVEKEQVNYSFKISNILQNGESIIHDTEDIEIVSLSHGKYVICSKNEDGKYLHKFFGETLLSGLRNFTYSNIVTFGFKSTTGILFIDDDKNDHYEIQLKFKSQIVILHHFLSFAHLRKIKITDKTVQEIQLKNNSEKIMLEKNNIELHKDEEVISTYYLKKRVKWNESSTAVNESHKFEITNFRIMQDGWCFPVFFDPKYTFSFDDAKKIISNSIISFTHDEYDDVFALNVKNTTSSSSTSSGGTNAVSFYGVGVNQELHSYAGTSEGSESGDIVFMSKGKIFCTWDKFVDPKGIVEIIKSAKKQFVSQDEKMPEPQVSLSDDDPLKILKKRYASGEISQEEFQKIKEDLV